MGNGTGGEIFAKTAKTPPLQSGVGGDIIAIQIRPLPSSMETRKLYNDAARRVATLFEKWDCMIETDLRASRENSPKKIDPIRVFRRGLPLGMRRFQIYSSVPRRT